jgi:hypothetical protein
MRSAYATFSTEVMSWVSVAVIASAAWPGGVPARLRSSSVRHICSAANVSVSIVDVVVVSVLAAVVVSPPDEEHAAVKRERTRTRKAERRRKIIAGR